MWSSVWEKWWVLLVLFCYLIQVKSRTYNTLNSRNQQLGTVFFNAGNKREVQNKCKNAGDFINKLTKWEIH